MKTGQPLDPRSLERTRDRIHPRCVVCNPANASGLRIEFNLLSDDSVMGEFLAGPMYEGYPGLLHGGVTAALLDGAMTNCLFAHGVKALTAELKVRYSEPVDVQAKTIVCARLIKSHGRLHGLRAELRQEGRLKATALGKFIESYETNE
jgi:acyl-coenzyme A thioesterase PaaI-like protein